MSAEMGQLILVTGPTGSGKSTTCSKFARSADDLWLQFGADLLLGTMVPRQYIQGGPRGSEGVHMAPDDPSNPHGPSHFSLGTLGGGMLHAFHEMLGAAARSGQNVIVDHITTMDPPILQDCVSRLWQLPVLFVALRPPVELLAERIAARVQKISAASSGMDPEQGRQANEALKNAARSMESQIFKNDCYDLIIDNQAMPPAEVAQSIRERLAEGPGTAFQTLASQFDVHHPPFGSSATMAT